MTVTPEEVFFQNLQPRSQLALKQAMEAMDARVPAVLSLHIERGRVEIEYSIVRGTKQ